MRHELLMESGIIDEADIFLAYWKAVCVNFLYFWFVLSCYLLLVCQINS
jgi:hypothetical protein